MVKKMEIRRSNYYIRPLRYEDGLLLKKWEKFTSPLLEGYNFNNMDGKTLRRWYITKQRFYRSSYFSILSNEDELIGYIGIKEINRFLKRAKLGIVLNAKMVSKGIGTSALSDFLEYYFNEINMQKLTLEVNDWNHRAKRLYEKLGFKYENTRYEYCKNQSININRKEYEDVRDSFEKRPNGLYTKIHQMSLTRQEYLNET